MHMSAGFAALAGAVHLGPRNIDRLEHANIPFIILGTGLLWFGWFGFNAGSALGANDDAVLALANTHFASAAGMISLTTVRRVSAPVRPPSTGWRRCARTRG